MQGYIHHSRKADRTGFITCCSGSCLADFFRFSFDDCSNSVVAKLQKDVTGVPKGDCSLTNVIKVRFESKISGSELVADDVRDA